VKTLANKGKMDGKVVYMLQAKQFAVEKHREKWKLIGRGC